MDKFKFILLVSLSLIPLILANYQCEGDGYCPGPSNPESNYQGENDGYQPPSTTTVATAVGLANSRQDVSSK